MSAIGASDLRRVLGEEDPGRSMHRLARELFPICRSTTGEGVRETLRILGRDLPLEMQEVPSGSHVLDWVVPPEWNVREAWIRGPAGETIVDLRDSNLHVVGHSIPVRKRLGLEELREHLHSLPEHPDWIPYRSSVYRETWGFCLPHRQLEVLRDGEYEVCIDSTLSDGSLTYGEVRLPGELPGEILLSAHICHPSLCNDNLSGVALVWMVGRYLAARPHRHSYRLLFAPTTIGAIAWLAANETGLDRLVAGLVVALVGDSAPVTYKRSRGGAASVDRAFELALRERGSGRAIDFAPDGYDERQFCSPGFDLPVGCMMRTQPGCFPEYHTSADDLDFVKPENLLDSLETLLTVLDVLDNDARYLNQRPRGEPQLGRHGIYRAVMDRPRDGDRELALQWVLNLSDGAHGLIDIAARSGLPFAAIRDAAAVLVECDLLRPGGPGGRA